MTNAYELVEPPSRDTSNIDGPPDPESFRTVEVRARISARIVSGSYGDRDTTGWAFALEGSNVVNPNSFTFPAKVPRKTRSVEVVVGPDDVRPVELRLVQCAYG